MRVKICGITNLEDALHAASCGADALGFVFYPPSPRYIAPSQAKKIIEALPPFVERVGLFVNQSVNTIEEIASFCHLSTVQLHFEIECSMLKRFQRATLPVIRARKEEDIDKCKEEYRLIDAYCESYGGSGKRLNLEWFKKRDNSRIIIAGGLNPDNLQELQGYGFYGVDVSSGVEREKGKKDLKKVERFIRYAKTL